MTMMRDHQVTIQTINTVEVEDQIVRIMSKEVTLRDYVFHMPLRPQINRHIALNVVLLSNYQNKLKHLPNNIKQPLF